MRMWKGIVGGAATLATQAAYAAESTGPAPDVATISPPPFIIAWPQPNFDILAGGFGYSAGFQLMSDNIWRGISLTAHRPGAVINAELREGWFYLGGDALNVTLPTFPTAQLDIYGGIRPAWGPLTFDFGAVYHGRPGNQVQWFLGGVEPVLTFQTPGGFPTTPFDQSFVEIYGKPSWAINEYLTIGAEFGYDPSWANYNAPGVYSSGYGKLSLPGTGFSISGGFGHYFLGTGAPTYGPSFIQPGIKGIQGFKLASYDTWNIGASYQWSPVTLDVRYHATTLTQRGCFTDVANPAGNFAAAVTGVGFSNWCEPGVFGSMTVNFDSTKFER
jgi:hypothetical protein